MLDTERLRHLLVLAQGGLGRVRRNLANGGDPDRVNSAAN
jgi:hypothetical protein